MKAFLGMICFSIFSSIRTVHLPICACHPFVARATRIFNVFFQFNPQKQQRQIRNVACADKQAQKRRLTQRKKPKHKQPNGQQKNKLTKNRQTETNKQSEEHRHNQALKT